MQTCSSGIEAYVTGNRFFQQLATGGSIGALLYKTPLFEDVKNVCQSFALRQFTKTLRPRATSHSASPSLRCAVIHSHLS
jgi:hypothetical protein